MMFLTFIRAYAKEIILVSALVVLLSSAYHHVYNRGYMAATGKYEEKLLEYNNSLSSHIAKLENLGTSLVVSSEKHEKRVTTSIQSIMKEAKTKPATVIVEGVCSPSLSFIDTYNATIRSANE